jgi:hypothetical protein
LSATDPVTLVPRDACLRDHPVLAQAVFGWQRAHDPGSGDAAWYVEMCDALEPDPAIRWAESLVLYLPERDLDETARELGPALARILEALGGRTLTFLHASRSQRWPTRRRTPTVLADAGRAFRSMGAGKSFYGGIRVAASGCASVLAPVLWSTRMDFGYGPVFVAADGVPLVASLCQYANLHVDVYSRAVAAAIREAAQAAGLAEWTDGICDERFAADGAIPGRRLSLGG